MTPMARRPAMQGRSPLAERLETPLFLSIRDPVRVRGRRVVRLDLHRGDAGEQRDLWAGALGAAADRLDGRLDALAAQFQLDADTNPRRVGRCSVGRRGPSAARRPC